MEQVDRRVEGAPLGRYFGSLRQRWWLIAIVVCIALGIGVVTLLASVPLYEAQSSLLRRTTNFDEALFQVRVFVADDPERELQTGSDLIRSDRVAQIAKEQLGTKRTLAELIDQVKVTASPATDIIVITASSTNPRDAAALANAFASAFISYRTEANQTVLQKARDKIDAELSTMDDAEKGSTRGTTLMQKSEELRVLQSMETGGYELVGEAKTPAAASSPRPVSRLFLSGVIGLVAGIILAYSLSFLDKRVRDEQGLRETVGVPVLASVPAMGSWRSAQPPWQAPRVIGFAQTGSAAFEPYRALRSNLKYFSLDRHVKSILVTSSLPREGKTVTTINLGLSLALSGARVILVEADMRRPQLHAYLGLRNAVGLSSVLVGSVAVANAVQPVNMDRLVPADMRQPPSDAATSRSGLFCLTSGPLPPNPAELLDSHRMLDVLRKVAADADYVLIDTPPLLLVSDAMSLVNHVDAVILSARMNSTRGDDLRTIAAQLRRADAHLIGVVAAGAKSKRRMWGGRQFEYYSQRPG